jgi:gliding motility-associated lipoprotein GldD
MTKRKGRMRKQHNHLNHTGLALTFTLAIIVFASAGCRKSFTPKPKSYFRIDFPVKKYGSYHSGDCDYRFEVPTYANVVPYNGRNPEPCWINIEFPGYKGTIHITYKTLHDDLNAHAEDIRTLAYKHIVKADDIIERPFSFPEREVYGIVYDIKGNTASSLCFFATDSNAHFLSGALYFNVLPNKDSLAPVIKFFSADVEHLINTLNWN